MGRPATKPSIAASAGLAEARRSAVHSALHNLRTREGFRRAAGLGGAQGH